MKESRLVYNPLGPAGILLGGALLFAPAVWGRSEREIETLLSDSDQRITLVVDRELQQYLTKRITPALALLGAIERKIRFLPLPTAHALGLRHAEIIFCLQKIIKEKSLQPMLYSWQEYMSDNFQEPTLFAKEFLLLLVTLLANTQTPLKRPSTEDALDELLNQTQDPLVGQPLHEAQNVSLQNVVNLYNAISDLPILNLLATIDFLVMQVQKLLQAYQLNSSLSWREWLVRYWWVAPITLFALLRVIIRQITMHNTHVTTIYRT